MSVSYRDSLIKSKHHLTIEPGVRASLSGTWNDNNGDINMGDDSWRDSTGLHEDFVFTTVQLEPRLQLEYRYSSLLLSADYSLQFYGRDLSSQLRDQQMEWQRAAVIGGSSIEWAPGAGHLLTLGSTLSVIHPDYQELSWYVRQDTDPNQLTQGNPDLTSTRTVSTDLTWRYNKGGFDLSTSTAFDYTTGEIDQTFNNRKIDGVDYRVFTWINTDFTRSLTQRLQLNWRSRFVAANMRAHYQYSWLNEPDTDDLSQFHNWEVRAEITVRPPGGWMFSTNGFYRSNTRSLYRQTKDIYTIGARIAKEFKRFTVYLEGQDLE